MKTIRVRENESETQKDAALAVVNYYRRWRDEARRLTAQTEALLLGRAEEGVEYDQIITRANDALDKVQSARNRYVALGGPEILRSTL